MVVFLNRYLLVFLALFSLDCDRGWNYHLRSNGKVNREKIVYLGDQKIQFWPGYFSTSNHLTARIIPSKHAAITPFFSYVRSIHCPEQIRLPWRVNVRHNTKAFEYQIINKSDLRIEKLDYSYIKTLRLRKTEQTGNIWADNWSKVSYEELFNAYDLRESDLLEIRFTYLHFNCNRFKDNIFISNPKNAEYSLFYPLFKLGQEISFDAIYEE